MSNLRSTKDYFPSVLYARSSEPAKPVAASSGFTFQRDVGLLKEVKRAEMKILIST